MPIVILPYLTDIHEILSTASLLSFFTTWQFFNPISSLDGSTRNQAEAQLLAVVESHYENAVMALCVELATEEKEIGNRIQAALYLKNLFTAQDENIKQAKLNKWKSG